MVRERMIHGRRGLVGLFFPKQGITLLEILAAMVILALAFIPIIGVLGTGATDTDVHNSYVFAQTSARNIMETVLDNVPFGSLRVATTDVEDVGESNAEPNVGELFNVTTPAYNVASFLSLIGNTAGVDNFARGELRDGRGVRYKAKMFVFPVPVTQPTPDWSTDLCFRHIPRPIYENATNAVGDNVWYTTAPGDRYVKPGTNRPYDVLPLPPPVLLGARELGAPQGPPGNNFCVMKRILLRIRWTMPKGGERSLEVYTAKANLDQ